MTDKLSKQKEEKTVSAIAPRVSFRMEGTAKKGECRLSLFGIKTVTDYEETYVEIKLQGGTLRIFGEKIVLTLMERGFMEVKGMIREIALQNE